MHAVHSLCICLIKKKYNVAMPASDLEHFFIKAYTTKLDQVHAMAASMCCWICSARSLLLKRDAFTQIIKEK